MNRNFYTIYFNQPESQVGNWLPQYALAAIECVLELLDKDADAMLVVCTNGRCLDHQTDHPRVVLLSIDQIAGIDQFDSTYTHQSNHHQFHYLKNAFNRLYATKFVYKFLMNRFNLVRFNLIQIESDVLLYNNNINFSDDRDLMYLFTPDNEAVASLLVMRHEHALNPIMEQIEQTKKGLPSAYIQQKIQNRTLTEMDFLFEYSLTGKVANLFDTSSSIGGLSVHDLRIHADYVYSNNIRIKIDFIYFHNGISEQNRCKVCYSDGECYYARSLDSYKLIKIDSLHLAGLKSIWMYLLRHKTAKRILPIMGLHNILSLYEKNDFDLNSQFLDFELVAESQRQITSS